MLIAATALSLYLANSGAAAAWLHFWHVHVGPASLGLHLSTKEWVNEGLMAFFFFVVGLDIKKEFVYGSLASIRQALLPCLGALGGMVVPMAVYTALNATGAAGANLAGWAVPMATDIAFAMGVYAFFAARMPAGANRPQDGGSNALQANTSSLQHFAALGLGLAASTACSARMAASAERSSRLAASKVERRMEELGRFLAALGRKPRYSPPTPSRVTMAAAAASTLACVLLFSCICRRMVSSG